MRRDLTIKVRLAGSEMARLDEMRGPTSRAEYLRRLLQGPPPEGDPTHQEPVQISTGWPRTARWAPAVALERALRAADPSEDDGWLARIVGERDD